MWWSEFPFFPAVFIPCVRPFTQRWTLGGIHGSVGVNNAGVNNAAAKVGPQTLFRFSRAHVRKESCWMWSSIFNFLRNCRTVFRPRKPDVRGLQSHLDSGNRLSKPAAPLRPRGPPAGQARGLPHLLQRRDHGDAQLHSWAENTACFRCFPAGAPALTEGVFESQSSTEPTSASAGVSPETAFASEGLELGPCLATCQ